MDFIPLLFTRKKALAACLNSKDLTEEKRIKINKSLQILNYGSLSSKVIVGAGVLFGVNWKISKPLTKRQIPLAIGSIIFCTITDFALSQYVWREHETDVVNLTGYNNGYFIDPNQMKQMRSRVKGTFRDPPETEDIVIEDDEPKQ